ncbi:cellobiohydrolase II [Pyronema domesticum]|uniref:Glucanase n=1 Tax=Pyronema omphalodes (strain CBS 100304) TaxID=1076935 RepID=U4LJ40_PYROM|nr:cellobiohydrolase II [Pyronema domesticum]CCX31963.1 Similar to Probable 1,4-beta-D-glucan cellobiohydrolase C; acc. no. A1CCN4 [Pyronema omphalodes CBS 100304]
MKSIFAASIFLGAHLVSAQSGAWAQCGGIGWSGATTCVSGYTCSKINDYYSQCIPGSASSTPAPTTTTSSGGGGGSSTTPAPTATNSGNPFSGKTQWANPYYASEVSSLAIPSFVAAGKSALATKAASVANVPSFTWLDTRAKIPSIKQYLSSIKAAGTKNVIVPFVVYNLPDRDCAAAASNGELSIANGGVAIYKTEYIDPIRAALLEFPDIPIALIIEPDSLANLVTNMGVAKCSGAADTYKTLVAYAIKQLALPNVSMYLDGGHGGWLGWPANLPGAAQLFAQIRKDAGSPPQLRGLATNVANYNGWSLSTCPAYTSPNPNCDEKRYVEAMVSALAGQGWADSHHVVDQGRSGKQPTGQIEQGDWCNAVGTGFGIRPTSNTGHPSVDAFVWVKPGGESDGTSDTSATRYDFHCGKSDALQPAPEAGTWFNAYFEQLLTNANPAF